MYPYNNPYWNINDQRYWCKMNGYGFPVSRIRDPFRYIIEQGKCNTFESEYADYLATQDT